MKTRTIASGLLVAALAAGAAVSTFAQEPGAAGRGPGYGPGYGAGPGMMGGYGPGPGMMGGYGPPPGMMGGPWGGPGYGPGPGGPRGGGPGAGWERGPGFGPGGPLAMLDLTDEQREKIAAIREENRSRNWQTMGQLRSEQFKLRRMYFSDQLDAEAYAAQQARVDELRRQLVKSQIESRKQIEGILTPEQRQQFRRFGPRWLLESNG